MNPLPPSSQGAPCRAEERSVDRFRDLIPDLCERAEAFRVSCEYVDDAVLEAFERQIRLSLEALCDAVDTSDEGGVRRQAHSLQGMGGAAGAPEVSVVGEELSRAAKAGNFARCAELVASLRVWSEYREAPAVAPAPPAKLAHAPEVPGRILVVDDERANRLYLRKLLTSRGGTVVEADSGEEALALAKRERPELVLVDVMMPGLSGYEVCRRLKEDAATQDVMVIMVTARTTPEDVEHAFVLGAFDYIRKPFHARELLARVRHALLLKRQRDELRQWQVRMTREMDAAGALQRKLLAREPFLDDTVEIRFAHQASLSVGGDVFNAIPLSGERVCFYVADVAGHGVAPAMIATLLKALVEDVAHEKADCGPAAMCCDIHRRFRHYVKNPESYASLFLAVLEPDGRCASFNCGHPVPLFLSSCGAPLPPPEDKGGMPIGLPDVGPEPAYQTDDEVRVTLPPDAMICVYSDGLVEARREGTQEFCGVETLAAALASVASDSDTVDLAHAVFDRLMAGGYNLRQDDCTLLVARTLNPSGRRLQRRLAPTYEAVSELAEEIERALLADGWSEESAGAVQLLAMEHGANVVKHAVLAPDDRIDFRLHLSPHNARLLFRDPGPEWDFGEQLAHTMRQPVESQNGRGLRIIWNIARYIDQIRSDGQNVTNYIVDRSFRTDRSPRKGDAI